MGAARKARDTMPTIMAIPTVILRFIISTSILLLTRILWFSSGLDVRCNKTFQKLKQLIRSVSPLDSVSETCIPEL